MSRSLNPVTYPLGKSQRLRALRWFKDTNELKPNVHEKTVISKTGFTTANRAYRHIANLYNDHVEQYNEGLGENRRVRKNAREVTKRAVKKEINNFLSIGEASSKTQKGKRLFPTFDISRPVKENRLGKYVQHWWKSHHLKQNEPFTLKLKSGIADIIHEWKFKNMGHFENWFEKATQDLVYLVREYGMDVEINEGRSDLWGGIVSVIQLKKLAGGCNTHKAGEKKLLSSFYKYNLWNPFSKNNNCFFVSLAHVSKTEVDSRALRKKFNIATGAEITVCQAYDMNKELNLPVEIIDSETNEELDPEQKYVVYRDSHYYALDSFESVVKKDIKTKRGNLAFDFETRPTEEFHHIKASDIKSYILKDTICCAYYTQYKSKEHKSLTFVSGEKSSARQFADFLNSESKEKRTYNVLAHNGGNFDFYFFLACLTEKELLDCDIQMRGTTVIGINYRGNLFKDSCCFLTDSLASLSQSFGVEQGKITNINVNGKQYTSAQLCFYKPELTYQQFLDLEHTDPVFWFEYTKYCLYDCIALSQIWVKFTECVNGLIEKINPYLLRKCPLMGSSTIGSHSKKILVELNKINGKITFDKENLERFTGITYKGKERVVDYEKYEFICNFKRGGISHCNQAGKHMSGTTGVDIASQYPASLIYSYIPTGASEWITEYDEKKHGFYLLKDLKFETPHTFKPVAKTSITSLNWATDEMNELYVDSYMLKYIIQNYGLKTFTVVKGLVSEREILASKLFGKYINTFYEEKKRQDTLKDSKDPEIHKLYNPALRTTIKLYLNSLTGKLVENPAIHFKLKFDENSTKVLNGVGITKEFSNEDKVNDWIVAGVMVYSYSKRLLFEYIKCLPNNSSDVIHVETDGIYFSTKYLEDFTHNLNNYEGEYPCKFGEDVGNLKIEKSTPNGTVSYFLGKKFYLIMKDMDTFGIPRTTNDTSDKINIYRVKGIPQKTIEKDGTYTFLVDTNLYEDVYNGETVNKTFSTLRKSLFNSKTQISTHELTRRVRPNCEYKLYE